MADAPPLEPQLLEPPPDRQAYQPFPRLAQAIRTQSDRILDEWRGRTLFSIPELGELTAKEFKDDIARILSALADALESNDPPDLQRLLKAAPAHGFHRFLQKYDLADLFAEERVLRRVIIAKVEEDLVRQCKPDEAAALHSLIDIMLQQGVLALVQQQKQDLRQASEVQLKYLTFLSHDLSNNFLLITLALETIQRQLAGLPQMGEGVKVVGSALDIINRTRVGMRGLLEHERLRKSGASPGLTRVNLRSVIEPIVNIVASDARDKGLHIEVAIDRAATVETNPGLLTIMLQNLIGNAVKHTANEAEGGKVRIEADRHEGFWAVSVVDDGPGISKDQLDLLFSAFQRLPEPGENAMKDDGGFGLGLAIASEAARLLDTSIEVKTQRGRGSTFSFLVPASNPPGGEA